MLLARQVRGLLPARRRAGAAVPGVCATHPRGGGGGEVASGLQQHVGATPVCDPHRRRPAPGGGWHLGLQPMRPAIHRRHGKFTPADSIKREFLSLNLGHFFLYLFIFRRRPTGCSLLVTWKGACCFQEVLWSSRVVRSMRCLQVETKGWKRERFGRNALKRRFKTARHSMSWFNNKATESGLRLRVDPMPHP